MIIADFTCPKCRAVLDLENVDEGQLINCPQCKVPFEIPRKKQAKIHPPAIPKAPVPPYPGWSVAANLFGGVCVLFAFVLLMDAKFDLALQAIASSVAFALTAFLIKVLCDIRWNLERLNK